MDAALYRAHVIAEHEAARDAAARKVDRQEQHLAAARVALDDAETVLAAAAAADHEFVEPTEHVTVRPR